MPPRLLTILSCVLLASLACAQPTAPAPAPAAPSGAAPASAASAPAPSQPTSAPEAPDPNVVRILKELEQAGLKTPILSADVRYMVEKAMIGDEELRTGKILIARAEANRPDRLYIRFDTLKQGDGAAIEDKVEYALDGEWLTEAKHRIKSLTRYQVAAPGQKVELFRLGKGPFPMPFGQKAEEVLEYFQASTRPSVKGDPNGTVYVKLVTKPKYKEDLNFVRLEIWADAKTLLPVKLISADRNRNLSTANFSSVKADATVDPKLFVIANKTGWQLNVVPLKKEGGP